MHFYNFRKFVFAAALAAAPVTLAPAYAATAAEVRPGMQVVDPAGGTVGMVTAVKGDALILKTANSEAQLPLTSFTAHEGKLMFGMTAAQLDAEMAKAQAEAAAAVAVGADVYGSDGTLAGTIQELDDQLVTIKMASGDVVRLPRSGVGGGANGAVLGVTTAQLSDLAAQASTSGQAAAATDEDTATQ